MDDMVVPSGIERLRGQPALERRQRLTRLMPRLRSSRSPAHRWQKAAAGRRSAGPSPRSARRGAAHSAAAASRRPASRQGSRSAITCASACTSARPRFRPWPASGCTTCAASPSSTQPGPHTGSARASVSGQAARSLASVKRAGRAVRGLGQCLPRRPARPCASSASARSSGTDQTSAYECSARGRSNGSSASTSGERNHCRATPACGRVAAAGARRSRAGRSAWRSKWPRRTRSRVAEALPSAQRQSAQRPPAPSATRCTCGAKRRAAASSRSSAGGVDDPGQRADALRPGRELEHAAGRRRRDAHVVAPGRCVVGQRVPDLQVAQQRHRRRRSARRRARRRAARPPRARVAQRHRQAVPRQRQRQARPTTPAPRTHTSKRCHRADCREAARHNRRCHAHACHTDMTALSDLSCSLACAVRLPGQVLRRHRRASEALLTETGLDLDRAWMVVDEQGEFVTQRELPRHGAGPARRCEPATWCCARRACWRCTWRSTRSRSRLRCRSGTTGCRPTTWATLAAQWFSDFLGQRAAPGALRPGGSAPVRPPWTGAHRGARPLRRRLSAARHVDRLAGRTEPAAGSRGARRGAVRALSAEHRARRPRRARRGPARRASSSTPPRARCG